MRTVNLLGSATLALAGLAPAVTAQGVYYAWQTQIGRGDVAPAGDVDADGVQDFAIGEAGSWGLGQFGRVSIRSGLNGALILTVQGLAVDDLLGYAVRSLGDVDLDGHADFAAGAPNAVPALANKTYVRAFSGASGAVLWHVDTPDVDLRFGTVLAIVGDMDFDGFADIAVGGPSNVATKQGQVLVLSGRTGAILLAIANVPGSTLELGKAVALAGDFDLDGVPDVLVGNPENITPTPGRVTLHSGATGVVLQVFTETGGYTDFGSVLAAVGDVDGDTLPDVMIGAPAGPFSTGSVRLYSGASATVLLSLSSSSNTVWFGQHVAAFQDLDGDGRKDLLITEGAHHSGCCIFTPADLVIYSSSTGLELYRSPYHSAPIAVVPDADGDGMEDYLIRGLSLGPGPQFVLSAGLVITGLSGPTDDAQCPAKVNSVGGVPYIVPFGAPSLSTGPDLTVQAIQVMGGSIGVFVWGLNAASIPFGGGTLCVAAPRHRSHAMPTGGTVGSANGMFSYTFSKPQLAALGYVAGTQFHVQAWYRDPGFAPPNAIGLTSSLTATVWP